MNKGHLLPNWISSVADAGRFVRLSSGTVLFSQGDEVTEFGFVLDGKLKAVRYSQNGHETWLCEFENGDLFGHLEMLNDDPLSHELTTVSETDLFILPISLVRKQVETSIVAGEAIASDLARRLKVMMDRYVEALTLSARGRVCAELLRLSKPIGVQPEHLIVRPNPVFVEFAIRINSTRETVSRTVSELQKEGVLTRETGALRIEKPGVLRAALK